MLVKIIRDIKKEEVEFSLINLDRVSLIQRKGEILQFWFAEANGSLVIDFAEDGKAEQAIRYIYNAMEHRDKVVNLVHLQAAYVKD